MLTPEPLNLLGEFRKIPIFLEWGTIHLPQLGIPWPYKSRSEVEDMLGEPIR